MGYSESLATIENRRELIAPLLKGETSVRWTTRPGEERTVAYQIRECLYIAKRNKNVYPQLADVAERVEVVQGRGEVLTRLRNPTPVVSVEAASVAPARAADPKTHDATMQTYSGTHSAMSIVQKWIDSGSRGGMHFPQAQLSDEELLKLHQWAEQNGVLVFWSSPSVTLKDYDEALVDYAFEPEDLNEVGGER